MTETTESFLFKRYPYISNNEFLILGNDEEGNKAGSFTEGDANTILSHLHGDIAQNISQMQAKALQDALNQAIADQYGNYQLLAEKMINGLDRELLGELQKLGPEQNGSIVTYNGASFSLSEKAAKDYDSKLRDLAANLPHKKEALPANAELRRVIHQLNGSLNTLRGDIFENILAYILRESGDIINTLVSKEGKALTDSLNLHLEGVFEKGLSKEITAKGLVAKNKESDNSVRVTGADLKKTISLTIDDKGYKVSGSKGKSDVAISTSLTGNFANIGISAKSYGGSRKIHLLSEANLAGLVSQWNTEDKIKNLALNAFSSRDAYNNQLEWSKRIFLFQALVGSSKEELLSQLLIINKNTKKNPYVVLSTRDLLANKKNLSAKFDVDAPTKEVPRSRDYFYRFAKGTKISVETNETVSTLATNANANIEKKP